MESERASDELVDVDRRGVDTALGLVRLLAADIGPRRPCSSAEKAAAKALAEWLAERSVLANLQGFSGYASFAYPYGAIFGLALIGGLIQRRRACLGSLLAQAALALAALEGDLRRTPVSDLLARRSSVNVVAQIPATGRPLRRVCLCAHVDSARSGLIFHPSIVGQLEWLLRVPAVSTCLLAGGSLLRRLPGGKLTGKTAIAGLALMLALLAERELRGQDVPGANDNASGAAVVCQLAAEVEREPFTCTQVDLMISGCEEAGLLGAQAYLRRLRHEDNRTRPIFINFDTVGGDAPLTYILREGALLARPATPHLIELTRRIAQRRPDLGLIAARTTAGLPTDVTAALARGYEGITFLAQGGTIPNYHWPTDTVENIVPGTVARALEVGRELLSEIDAAAAGHPEIGSLT